MTGSITQGMQWIGPLSVYSRVTSINAVEGGHIVVGQAGWRYQGECVDQILEQQKEQGVKFAFQVPKLTLITAYKAAGMLADPDAVAAAEAQALFGGLWAGFRFQAGVDIPVQRLTDRIEVEYEMRIINLPKLLVLPVLQTYGTITFESHHQLSIRVLRQTDPKTLVETDATIDERGRLLAAWADPMLAAEMLIQGGHR